MTTMIDYYKLLESLGYRIDVRMPWVTLIKGNTALRFDSEQDAIQHVLFTRSR